MELEQINGVWYAFPVNKYGNRPGRDYWISGKTRDIAIENYIVAYLPKQASLCKAS